VTTSTLIDNHLRPARTAFIAAAVVVGVALALALREPLRRLITEHPGVAAWLTSFVSIGLQSLPFLVLGVVLAAMIAVVLPADTLARWLPRRTSVAVPVAAVSGVALPGCECGSVPIAGALVSKGIRPAVALTFLLAAPAVNPIVLVSTAVAFSGQPEVVVARGVAALATATIVGWVWLRLRRDDLLRPAAEHDHGTNRLEEFVGETRHHFLHAGGFLVIGSAIAATVNTVVPSSWLSSIGGNLVVSIVVLAAFAVVLAVCSEADAFVAASLTMFPLTARLVFMVVGPVVDVKLFAMQAGTFGHRFASVFAPLSLGVAVVVATLTGLVLL
jgi:uncharacterized membrane protein YraQ (UPF0718 family)